MMEWHFLSVGIIFFIFLFCVILYEKHLCSKIDKQLTRLEKLVDKQGDSNEMDN